MMTRYLIIILCILTLLFSTKLLGQNKKSANYTIEVKNWGLMFSGDTKWIISKDSISFERQNISGTTEVFTKKLSQTEDNAIVNLLAKIDLSSINNDNVNNSAPDDMGEYDFKFTINGATKGFHVYQVKIDEVFNLVKQINKFLPDKYNIGYNEAYFAYKK